MAQNCNITLSENSVARIEFLMQNSKAQNVFLRISVSSGGCAGFQYHFDFDSNLKTDDLTLVRNGRVFLALDNVSHELIGGSQVDFVDELGGSYFKLVNPKASSTCGCGSSFAI
jgi:iron-sulfur cluster insertion protein